MKSIAIILDTATGITHFVEVPEHLARKDINSDEIIDALGFPVNDVSYMISNTPLEVRFHMQALKGNIKLE